MWGMGDGMPLVWLNLLWGATGLTHLIIGPLITPHADVITELGYVLRGMPRLATLVLISYQSTPADVLGGLTSLISLRVTGYKWQPWDWEALSGLPKLRHLVIEVDAGMTVCNFRPLLVVPLGVSVPSNQP